MLSVAKKFLPILFAVLTVSCSSSKDIPTGKRLSIVDSPEPLNVSVMQKKDITLSLPENIVSWSQFGSNAAHLHQNIQMNDETEKQWTADFGTGTSKRNLLIAVPVVDNGIVYAQDVHGTVSAFDLKTGDTVFSVSLNPLNKNDATSGLNGAGLAVNHKNLYALTGFGGVFALDALTGKILWRQDIKMPIRTAPVLADNILFVQTLNNQLIAFNATDGSELWRYNISAEDTVLAGGATPAVDSPKDTIIAAFSNGELQAFNTKIGYPVWSQNLINTNIIPSAIYATKASPVIDNHIVYAPGSHAQTIAVKTDTGEIVWQIPIGALSSPLVDKEVLFMVSGDYELLALSKQSGQIAWRAPVLDKNNFKNRRNIYIFTPLLINNNLLVITSNGIIRRFDAKTGQLQSEKEIGENIAVQPIVADGSLILTTKNAKLVIFR